MSIQESNKLIAEFMGAKVENKHVVLEARRYALSIKNYPNQLQYHKSWEWIMPVVEKIEKQGCIVEICFSLGCLVRIIRVGSNPVTILNEGNDSIKTVYQTVVEYIVKHNSQPSNTTP